jgi:hypothetical protein
MPSFISIFITVGVCLAIYAYIKKKYAVQIAQLQGQIADLNLEILNFKSKVKQLDDRLFVSQKEVSSYKTKLDTMVDINKELAATKTAAKPIPAPAETTSTEPKKRGRKPGYKKPFYKKKSGGKPS